MKLLLISTAIGLSCISLFLARDAVRDTPERIDVFGHCLRMRVEGQCSPTVVLEIGLGGILEEWTAVQPQVARFTRVVAYDRLGAGHGPDPLTGTQVAHEVHAALQKIGAEPPYVLVGQSFGGIYSRIFASMYPDEVVGLVLLDPSQEDFIEWIEAHYPKDGISKLNTENWPEGAGIRTTLDELKTGPPLPDVPVVVVTAARPSDEEKWQKLLPVWTASHDVWVKSLPQGRHVITDKSGHGIHVEQPELVIQLIREVVDQSRAMAR